MIENKNYLLEKIYDKYKMEIARKDRLESKAIGYYTITGISFAAFLVIVPFLFEKGHFPILTIRELLGVLFLFVIAVYLVLFVIQIVNLHGCYKPKVRSEFQPIQNWDDLIKLQNESYIESIKVNLVEIIKQYEKTNSAMAERISRINNLCFVNMLLVLAVFIILVATYFV